MAKETFRIDKTREDREIEELVEGMIQREEFYPMCLTASVFEGLKTLRGGVMDDAERAMKDRGMPPEAWEENKRNERIENLAQCAWNHFKKHYDEKMRTSLIELIQESSAFADAIFLQRCGESEEEINEVSPSIQDLQQNILRRSVKRLRGLPIRKETGMESAESEPNTDPLLRATYEIQNNLVIWAYDHVRLYEHLKEALTLAYQKKGISDTDDLAHGLAAEMAELIWDNIGEALGVMVRIMIGLAESIALPSFAERHGIKDRQIKEHKKPLSDIKKELIDPLIGAWAESLTPFLKTAGGSEPVANVSDDDCLEFVQRYDQLLTVLKEASDCYKECASGWGDTESVSPLDEVRHRFSSRLPEGLIVQISSMSPSEIALLAASKGLSMQGYKKRALENFRKRGREFRNAISGGQ